ncbi:MAG: nickel pincer cofactor biosynthesis protein LarC [Promethearchaeia archaeon]
MIKLYIDAKNSGLSGDMFLASLLKLVEKSEDILSQLTNLKDILPGVQKLEINQQTVPRSGVNVNQLNINIKEGKEHRKVETLRTALTEFLEQTSLSEGANKYARSVLDTLIEAELSVHKAVKKNIHLHELSSVDTLLDIMGAAMALDTLKIFSEDCQVYCSEIPLGGGKIETAHGTLPIPAPATAEILKKSEIETRGGPVQSELLTPTGAALIVNLKPIVASFLPAMKILNIGYGCGQKTFKEFLNTVRVFLGTSKRKSSKSESHSLKKYSQPITMLTTNIDDVPGELIGDVLSSYPEDRVLDIQVIPSMTKKNRTAHQIQVLCDPVDQFELIEWMINELGTLGVRYETIQRICVERKIDTLEIPWKGKKFKIRCKISYIGEGKAQKIVNVKPEYDDLYEISIKTKEPVRKVRIKIMEHISKKFF